MKYEILPYTGLVTPWFCAVRDSQQKFVFETKSYISGADATEQAQIIVRKLEIAEAAEHYCNQLCSGDQHVPNCPVHTVNT